MTCGYKVGIVRGILQSCGEPVTRQVSITRPYEWGLCEKHFKNLPQKQKRNLTKVSVVQSGLSDK